MIRAIIHILFVTYTWLLFIRVIGSWFPRFRYKKFFHFVSFYTDPYLKIFQKLIPPIGGVLDLSPLLGFFVLYILEQVLLSFFR